MRSLKCYYCKVRDYIRYDIPYGIENLIKWFPVIWQNRDWDHYFIYTVLRHKLHLTEQHIRHHDIHTHAQRDAEQIKLCVLLLDRLIADNYHEMAFKKVDEKWGDLELSSTPCEDRPGLHAVHITRPNIITEEDEKQERKEFKRAIDHERYLKDQDKRMLFQMMEKYIEGWWD